jgi:hypothetical protein
VARSSSHEASIPTIRPRKLNAPRHIKGSLFYRITQQKRPRCEGRLRYAFPQSGWTLIREILAAYSLSHCDAFVTQRATDIVNSHFLLSDTIFHTPGMPMTRVNRITI